MWTFHGSVGVFSNNIFSIFGTQFLGRRHPGPCRMPGPRTLYFKILQLYLLVRSTTDVVVPQTFFLGVGFVFYSTAGYHTTTHSTQHSQHRQDGRASDEHVISVPMSSPCLISENVGNSSEKQGGTEDWGWSSSTTGGGSFQRGRGQLNQGGTGDTTSVTTTISTNLQHQTSSDGLTLTEERDGDFDGGDVRQQYETPTLPTGCIFKFILLSTHGDPHYVGLNGLELYDKNNVRIELDETNVEVSFLDSFFFFFSCICFSHPLPTHPTLSHHSHIWFTGCSS